MSMSYSNMAICNDVDMAANFVSAPIVLNNVIVFAIHSVFIGTPNGTLILEASCDDKDPVNFVAIDTQIIAAAGSKLFNYPNCGFKFVRLSYIANGGAGILNARVNCKGN